MSEKLSENSEMSSAATAAEAQRLLHQGWPSGKVNERILAASRALNWTYNRTRDLWYRQAHRVDGHEILRLQRIENKSKRRARDAKEDLDRALALVASHLAAEAAQGDRDAAHALRKIVSAMAVA